jgi:hypothetical protein
MLSATKILLIILGLLFLFVGVLGHFLSGYIIGLGLIGVAVIIDRNSKTHPSAAKSMASVFVVLLGLFLFGVIQFIATLPNIDTTGTAPAGATAIGVAVAAIVIVGGLLLINRPKK